MERLVPSEKQVLIAVQACGVCRTDLHVIDGELSTPKLPLVLGHEIVGESRQHRLAVTRQEPGQRLGAPWLGETCGHFSHCDGEAFFERLARVPLQTTVTEYALSDANCALQALRAGRLQGAAVLPSSQSSEDSRWIGVYGTCV